MSKLYFTLKNFDDLQPAELYNILKLRSEVFVVEQNCVFLDMDDRDQYAMHLLGTIDNQLVAYTRLYNKTQYYQEASIGRVVVCPKHRNLHLGKAIIQESIDTIERIFETKNIRIGAQCYLQKFYESLGFVIAGETYLEDGIPHVEMVL